MAKRYANLIKNKKFTEVKDYFLSRGWSHSITELTTRKQSHYLLSYTDKRGITWTLDYNPVGVTHGTPYYKLSCVYHQNGY